jgi:signal transduction histidine kinase
VILCIFAIAMGALTGDRIRNDFAEEVADGANRLKERVALEVQPSTGAIIGFRPNLTYFAAPNDGAARIVDGSGHVLRKSRGAPDLGQPLPHPAVVNGYRVESRRGFYPGYGVLYVQYGRPVQAVEATVRRVRLFLVGGVIAGAGLALLAGLMIATRAMKPIAELTETAREIERTRDPGKSIPIPDSDDEITELARTLDGMLQALDASRDEQTAMLRRQREFVADASHELRTPLTSVLANLEFLAETLDGEQGDAARAALRSSKRMRRLVQDLLLLARADARRVARRERLDVGRVVIEAAAELEPVADGHALSVDTSPAVVDGAADELHRLALNLMENAIKHTPEGTRIHAAVGSENGHVLLTVEDDGPGIPQALRDKIFDRFVRGEGDRGGSFGLGLSIVRAVAESHGGSVEVAAPVDGRGTRFVVTLPAAGPAQAS